MKKVFFSSIVALAFMFSACNKDIRDQIADEDAIGVKAIAVSSIVWNGDVDKDVAVNIEAVQNNTRKNASGAKITSNAHSADFPGIYFIWDSKQKDNGYLKVAASVFNQYRFFILTSKESSTYWDFAIIPQIGQQLTEDNCYVFFIPKVYNNKNINMVFIGEVKDVIDPNNPPTIVIPPVIDPGDCADTYYILSGPGTTGVVVDPKGEWKFGGMDIKSYWNSTLAGGADKDAWAAMMGMKSINGTTAEWVWDRGDSWKYGISGAQMVLGTIEFNINGNIVEDNVPFYFACDNAAVVFVNGNQVGYTEYALEGRTVPDINGFTGFGDAEIDGQAWQHVYTAQIKDALQQGVNKIVVIAANSDENDGAYNMENNPAGLIFAAQFSVENGKCPSDIDPFVNLGFIGYYVYEGKVMSTSFYWQELKEGDMIDWDAVDAAYDAWVAKGGLQPDRTLWQTSGYATFTFEDKAPIGFDDFNIGQIESYYKAYYVSPGYVLDPTVAITN